MKSIILNLEIEKHYDFDALRTIHLSVTIWNNVSQKNIPNSFRRTGFKREETILGNGSDTDVSSDKLIMQDIRRREPQVPADLRSEIFWL